MGKSAVALELAEALGDVELVSIDSMQVYRGMDVGTAKATPADRARVPHHLLDLADPHEEWSVARFQREARSAIAGIEARGRRALLVGGTGLYVRAVVDDLRFPGEDPEGRARLTAEAAEPGGPRRLHARLAALDPVAAARIEPGNVRRTVRALEVIGLTGTPFSAAGTGLATFAPPVVPVRMFGLWLPPAVLDARIDARVLAMYADGLLDEAARLTGPARPPLSATAAQAIGYREAIAVVDGSAPDVDAARAATVRRTRRFARRQVRWFRRDPRVIWWGTVDNPHACVPALLECCR